MARLSWLKIINVIKLTPAALAIIARLDAKNPPQPDMERVRRAASSIIEKKPETKIVHDAGRRHYMKPGYHRGCSGFSQPNFFQ